MKNKYMALLMCLIICFSLICGSVSAADVTDDTETTAVLVETTGEETEETTAADETTKAMDDIINDKFEEIFSSSPSEMGENIMDGVYETHGFLAKIMEALENIKIFFVNFMNTFLSKLPFDVPMFK